MNTMTQTDVSRLTDMYMERYNDGGFTDSESARSAINSIITTTIRMERGEIRWGTDTENAETV
jgi:hypothetical protein